MEDFFYGKFEFWQHVKEDRDNKSPVRVIIVVYEPVAQPGNFRPGYVRISFFEGGGQIIGVFSNLVERGSNCPLQGFLFQDSLGDNSGFFQIGEQFAGGGIDFLYPLQITVLHAIFTPSSKMEW